VIEFETRYNQADKKDQKVQQKYNEVREKFLKLYNILKDSSLPQDKDLCNLIRETYAAIDS
jgi:hypothetical protein